MKEGTYLHSLHPLGSRYTAYHCQLDSVPVLALDWQRLLYVWICLRQSSNIDDENEIAEIFAPLHLMESELSTEGVTSNVAQDVDPQRLSDYRLGLVAFRKRLKKKLANGRHPKLQLPSVQELERMLCQIETNCHARPFPDASVPVGEHEVEKEEWVGIWLMGSMANHSCVANVAAVITSPSCLPFENGKPTHPQLWLELRAVRPIKEGDEITLDYHGSSILCSSIERHQKNARRGFMCSCPLCLGKDVDGKYYPDYSRRFNCPACSDGHLCPLGSGLEHWWCDYCRKETNPIEQCSIFEQWMIDADPWTFVERLVELAVRWFPDEVHSWNSWDKFEAFYKRVNAAWRQDAIGTETSERCQVYKLIHPMHSIFYFAIQDYVILQLEKELSSLQLEELLALNLYILMGLKQRFRHHVDQTDEEREWFFYSEEVLYWLDSVMLLQARMQPKVPPLPWEIFEKARVLHRHALGED